MTHTLQRPHPHRQIADRRPLAGAAAAVGLLILLAGLPAALGQLLGSPLPSRLPGLVEVRQWLTSPLDDHALLTVLALAAWLAWAHLAASIILETRRQLHARHLPAAFAPSVRPTAVRGLFSLNRQLAERLVAAALLLLPASVTTLAPAAHAVPLTRAALTQPIAAKSFAANSSQDITPPSASHSHPPTTTATVASHARAVDVPPDQASAQESKEYVVCPPDGRHYDSLWDIAQRHLGNGRRFTEIYHLNRGRPQPDGGTLTRASLIRPGWVLLLPADATGPDLRPARIHHAAPAAEHEPAIAPTTDAPPSPTPHRNNDSSTLTADRTEQATPADRVAAPVVPTTPTASPEPARGQPDATTHDVRLPLTVPLGLGIGALGALEALRRYRRIAQRRRPQGTRPAPVPPHLVRIEAGLRREAKAASAVADTVRLACALAAPGTRPGSVTGVQLHDSGAVRVGLAEDHTGRVPAPFVAVPGGWELPANAVGYTFAADELADPLPALLPVGRADDAEHFVNLSHDRLISVSGPDSDVVAFLIAAAASLAGAPWAGQVRILTPPDLAVRIGALERLDTEAELVGRVPELLAITGSVPVDDPLEAAQDCRQIVVLIGWTADALPALLTAAALDPRSSLVALVRGRHPDAAATWQTDGQQLIRPGHLMTTLPRRTAGASAIPELLEHARLAAPVAADDECFEEVRTQAPPQAPPPPAEDAAGAGGPAFLADDAVDQADGRVTDAAPISVRILGPVDVHGAPPPRRTPVLQILVYLAVHRRGVDANQLATALWPETAAAAQTLRNRVGEARSIVRGHITAGPRWQLDEQIGCDWQHFQALAAGDDDEQRAALELVRGRPFEDMADTEWIHLEGLITEIEAAVVDLAMEVATRALDNGEPAAAFAAARAGLRASPYEERLYRLAMRAADAEGSTGKIRAVMHELRTVLDSDIEPDDTIAPETLELYQQLMDGARQGTATD